MSLSLWPSYIQVPRQEQGFAHEWWLHGTSTTIHVLGNQQVTKCLRIYSQPFFFLRERKWNPFVGFSHSPVKQCARWSDYTESTWGSQEQFLSLEQMLKLGSERCRPEHDFGLCSWEEVTPDLETSTGSHFSEPCYYQIFDALLHRTTLSTPENFNWFSKFCTTKPMHVLPERSLRIAFRYHWPKISLGPT